MSAYITTLNPFTGKLQFVLDTALLKIRGTVNTYNDLPLSGNNENDCYIVKDTDKLYTWNKSESSGVLTDWKEIGSASSIDWSAIQNKPSSSVADIDDAVSKRHIQNTDTKLDEGGVNEIAVSNIKNAVDISHVQNTDTKLDEGGLNEVTAQQLKELTLISNSAENIIADIEGKLQLPYTVLHTDTDPNSLNTVIQSLSDGDILEVNSTATYNPISIPSDKSLIIRPSFGTLINISGTECIKLMNGARDTIIAGVVIETSTSPAPNERGAGISFGEHLAIVSNISFYDVFIGEVTLGSGVMLSHHWTVDGDTYYTPNTIEECSTDIRFINCAFYKANKDNTEGGSLTLRGVIGAFLVNNHFNDDTQSMRQIQLQNCISSYLYKNNICNTATPGTNSEGIKIDDLGGCTYRNSAYLIENVIKNAIEGIDIDDNSDAFLFDNICYDCTEEGISVDDSSTAILVRNLVYNCRFDVNSSGIRVENGAWVSMHQNNCVNNITNYRIENGYSLPSSNTQSMTDIILKDTAVNVIYAGNILTAFNVKDALEYLNTQKINSEASGDWKKITNMQYNPVSGDLKIEYET